MGISVKVMRSFDYCHFEICLGDSEAAADDIARADELRKEAARLADKAVRQYKIAKAAEEKRASEQFEREQLARECERIRSKEPDEQIKVSCLKVRRYDQEEKKGGALRCS